MRFRNAPRFSHYAATSWKHLQHRTPFSVPVITSNIDQVIGRAYRNWPFVHENVSSRWPLKLTLHIRPGRTRSTPQNWGLCCVGWCKRTSVSMDSDQSPTNGATRCFLPRVHAANIGSPSAPREALAGAASNPNKQRRIRFTALASPYRTAFWLMPSNSSTSRSVLASTTRDHSIIRSCGSRVSKASLNTSLVLS